MKLLRNGCTRWVLLIGSVALKFPRPTSWNLFLHGLLANMQEAEFSKTKAVQLCPTLLSVPGGFLNVMARARPLTDQEWEALDTRTFLEEFERVNHYVPPVEEKRCSFAVLENRIVVVDYGS